jgi:hypothetical protein
VSNGDRRRLAVGIGGTRLGERAGSAPVANPMYRDAAYDVVFAMRVGALDGRHPEAGECALRQIALASTRNARLFIDGGDPIRELAIPRF